MLGRFEHDVEIWDLSTRKQYAAFTTHYDFGGHRLALSDELNLLFAGSYRRHGLTAHDAVSGQVRWVRKDLKKVQVLALSADGRRVFCGREGSPCEVVSGIDGVTEARLKGTKAVWESAWEPVALLERSISVLQDRLGEVRLRLPTAKNGLLDVTFAPGRLYVAEIAGIVRSFSTGTGEELWQYDPGAGTHVLSLCYRPSDGRVVAIEWPYQHGGASRLLCWNASTHETEFCYAFDDQLIHEIAGNGELVIDSERKVFSTRDGTLLFELHARDRVQLPTEPSTRRRAAD